MPKVGDRVIIEGQKLGQVRREGKLLERVGTLLKIRWNDGSESLLTPGAGTIRFEPSSGKGAATRAASGRAPAAKGAAKSARATKSAASPNGAKKGSTAKGKKKKR
ncbi:MAG TPA: DUF1918 domain-containing protein [Actinomycetota bacterium]